MPEFVAEAADAGARLDVFVARRAEISRALAERLIAEGNVVVDGARAGKSSRLGGGARVTVVLPDAEEPPQAESIDVRVVYEDDVLLVISKPAGLVVHPASGHAGGTLVNALLGSTSPAGGSVERPGIVHRLDAGTSGLMIVAKDERAHARLTEMMKAREVSRSYLVLTEGVPDTDTLTIDAPIGRSPKHRKRMAVVAGGKDAVTDIEVLERFASCALMDARPRTGRTHQIRVHLATVGHAVVGDPVYGKDKALARMLGLTRQFLHAARLEFAHPMTGARIALDDPLPPDLAAALARARSL